MTIFATIVEALFPISSVERELFSYSPEKVLEILPKPPIIPIARAYSVFAYKDERVSSLVWNIKYKKSKLGVAIGGYALHQRLTELAKILSKNTRPFLILPLPITDRRRQERGYNQCELLVEEIIKLDKDKSLETNFHLLLRIHHLSRQTLKDRKERIEDARGIFSVNNDVLRNFSAEEMKKRLVFVVDDVITTGSTIKEAMLVLETAGFKNVYGISLAH